MQMSDEEVKYAAFNIHPDKAPGLDGFLALFFQRFLQIVVTDVAAAVKVIQSLKKMPRDVNSTFLLLFPKSHEQSLSQIFNL